MAYAAIVGGIIGRIAFQEMGTRPTPIIVAGASGGLILLWATIALRGWDVQTMIGDTLIERLNRFVFKVACVVGTILAVTSASWGIGGDPANNDEPSHPIVIERTAVEQSVGKDNRAMGVMIATIQVLIAVGVGVIAFMQWRTAHQKVLIDLFERRVKVYDKVNDAVSFYLTSEGNLKTFSARAKLSERAPNRALSSGRRSQTQSAH